MQDSSANNTSKPSVFDRNLTFLASANVQPALCKFARGIEKEGLRVTSSGHLAMSAHPEKLGSALSNPWLTTDFSEALLEFITPVFESVDDTLNFLQTTHAVAYKHMVKEMIWPTSMPCILPNDDQIPLAQYGSSNVAQMKTAYRRGLGHRYGRSMQTVAGIHYNFSFPQEFWQSAYDHAKANNLSSHTNLQLYINERYFDLIRNFRRNYWLLIYLFGSAPSVDQSFVTGREHNLVSLGQQDLYLPMATSLRMGDLGYQSSAQQSLFVCYNQLDTYVETLLHAMDTPYPDYKSIGLEKDGVYQQLSTSLLQIENEFYSAIRPKRVALNGENPLSAIANRGIEYLEVRCMDIDPFSPLGIDAETIRFLDTFLLYCLTKESPLCDEEEFRLIGENQSRIVSRGRDPELKIYCGKSEIPMRDCATGLLSDIAKIAKQMDFAHQSNDYSRSNELQLQKVNDASLTPSAKILSAMADNNESHISFTLNKSEQYRQLFQESATDTKLENELMLAVDESITQQAELERDTSVSFSDYLKTQFEQYH